LGVRNVQDADFIAGGIGVKKKQSVRGSGDDLGYASSRHGVMGFQAERLDMGGFGGA
jgi:hypothetical protein